MVLWVERRGQKLSKDKANEIAGGIRETLTNSMDIKKAVDGVIVLCSNIIKMYKEEEKRFAVAVLCNEIKRYMAYQLYNK